MWHAIATDKMRKFLNNGVSKKIGRFTFFHRMPQCVATTLQIFSGISVDFLTNVLCNLIE